MHPNIAGRSTPASGASQAGARQTSSGYCEMLTGLLLVLIFIGLSGLHWYWVINGTGDFNRFVPEINGKSAFQPGRLATAVVAVLLLIAAAICASQAELFGITRYPLARTGTWGLLVVFSVRAIGDFRLVGLFKRVRNTQFGRLDTWVYSPLCLSLSILCGALLHMTR